MSTTAYTDGVGPYVTRRTELMAGGPMTVAASSPVVRRRWWLYSLLLASIGCAVAFLGVIYGALLVGVPSQDPTPEMARREAFHVAVSGWIMIIGGGLFVCGGFALLCALSVRAASRGRG